MKCVVTGGAGFIGSHLVDALVEEGHDVTVIDDMSSGTENNLVGVKEKITLIKENILKTDLNQHFKGKEAVFHLAALTSVPESIEHPRKYHEVNVTGTLRVLEAARKSGVQKVVNSSSAAVYGNVNPPCREDKIGELLSPYAITKYIGEKYCEYYNTQYGLKTVSLRYFNIYGPRQKADSPYASVIPKFISMIRQGKCPTIYGDGEQSRDFIYVEDVVNANMLAAKSNQDFEGIAINIANGAAITVNQLVKQLNKTMGIDIRARYLPERPGDIKYSYADNTRARERLGYKEVVSLQEGLRLTAEANK